MGRARSHWRCGVVGVKARPEAELKFPQIRPVRAGDFASSFPLRARVGPVPQLRVRWHGLLQRLQASLHDEEEESRAKRATLLDAHRARHLHGLSVQVKGHLEVHVHALDDVDKVRWYAHLGEHRPEHVPRHRVKRLDQVHEQHPRLQPVLPPLLQSLADAKAPVCDTSTAGKAVLLFEADLFQKPLKTIINDHRQNLGGGVEEHDASPVVEVPQIALLWQHLQPHARELVEKRRHGRC